MSQLRGSLVLLLLCLVSASALALPAAADCAETVVVDDLRFSPPQVGLCEGGTVTWEVREGGHTIVADDGRFAFRGDGTLAAGQTVSHTVGETPEFIGYRCEIHASMTGRIVVGGGPPPPPQPIIRVPQDEPSLHDAVLRARPGHVVEIAPGTYPLDRTLVLDREGIELRGTGQHSDDVVLDASGRLLPTAVSVPGSHVTLTNLSVTGARTTGVLVEGVAVGLDGVSVHAGPLTREGILLQGVSGAGLRDVSVHGMARAGVEIQDCAACGVAIDGLTVTGSGTGLHLRDAAGVIIRDLHATGNTTGVVAHGTNRPAVLALSDSVIAANTKPATINPAEPLLGSGAGIVLAGVADSQVTGTTVTGHHGYGIVLATAAANRTSIAGNTTSGNDAGDLAWDGLGVATCFAAAPDAEPPTTDPPTLLVTAGCTSAAPASPPWPTVTANVLAGGATASPDRANPSTSEELTP